MNRLILLFSLFFVLNVNAQDNSLSRYIEWEKGFFDPNGRLSFKNAFYSDTINIPFYFEQIELPFSAKIKISIIRYEKIENIQITKGLHIPDSINISVYYGSNRKKNTASIRFLPIYKSRYNDSLYVVKSFSITISSINKLKNAVIDNQYSSHSVLNSGKWYKIKLKTDGIYKITYSQLKEKGFSNPQNVSVYGNGGAMLPKGAVTPVIDDLSENAVVHVDKGKDSYLLFYGQSPDVWTYNKTKKHFFHKTNAFSEYSYYYLTENQSSVKQVVVSEEPTNNNLSVSTFDDYQFHEVDKINLLASGAKWLGEGFSQGTNLEVDFPFSNIVASENAFLYYDFVATSSFYSYFNIRVEGKDFRSNRIASIDRGNVDGARASEAYGEFNFTLSEDNPKVKLTYLANDDNLSQGYLDYIGINVKRTLKLEGDQLLFRNASSVDSGSITLFNIVVPTNDVEVWDITDVCNAKKMNTTYNNGILSFTAATNNLRQFIAFRKNANFPSPFKDDLDKTGVIKNQDIHGKETPDLIIVSPSDTGILRQALRLADFRTRNDKMNVLTVTTDEIYNEFSSGKPDIAAIRNMVKMFYDRSSSGDLPAYLLLFGDGSYDNKKIYDPDKKIFNNNLIPTYQSETSYYKSATYTSDDFYGWLDDSLEDYNNLLDIGIGRLPIKDKDEAESIVNKIINYSGNKTLGPWRNVITLIGDDDGDADPANTHVSFADTLAKSINKEYPEFIVDQGFLRDNTFADQLVECQVQVLQLGLVGGEFGLLVGIVPIGEAIAAASPTIQDGGKTRAERVVVQAASAIG
jgi:hypothetical protein